MRSENKAVTIGIFLCVIQMIAIFIAIFNMPYGYYQFLRIFVFICSNILFFVTLCVGNLEPGGMFLPKSFAPLIYNVIVFNPIKPVVLNKGGWIVFDILAILMLLWLMISYDNSR